MFYQKISIYAIFLVILLGAAKPETKKLSEHSTIVSMHKEALKRRGGRAIELDEECCKIAQEWADHMAKTRQFRHGGQEQIIAQGYSTVKSCFDGWMDSSGHRRIILSYSKKCGWGFRRSSTGHTYWVGVFR